MKRSGAFAVVLSALCLTFLTSSVFAQTLNELRDQFKYEENSIIEKYDRLANEPGANKARIQKQMVKELEFNRQRYSALAGKDGRFTQAEVMKAFDKGKIPDITRPKMQAGYIDELQAALKEKGLKLQSTGGSADLTPSHLNADVDAVIVRSDGTPATAAEQLEGIEVVKTHRINKGLPINENAARFDVGGKDLTIWKPDSPEAQAAKLTDHDAFKTEGGKHVTRNPGAVQDAHGEYLDNRAKFEAARVEGDLKTQAKSLVKAGGGEASGVKTLGVDKDGNEIFERDSNFKKRNPELYEKAQKLKEYGTTHEAGITEVGDSPEVKAQKIKAFQEEMTAEMDDIAKEAKRKGKPRETVRKNFEESYEKAGKGQTPERAQKGLEKTNAELNAERAAEIKTERGRVIKSNRDARQAIAKDQANVSAEETYTGGRKGPGDPGYENIAQPEETAVQPKKGKAVSLEKHIQDLVEAEHKPSVFDDDPAVKEVVRQIVEEPSPAAGELEQTKTGMKNSAKGKPSASLLDGGQSSSSLIEPEGTLKSKAMGALEAANKLDDAAAGAVGVGELSAGAGAARRAVNAAGEAAMHGLGVVGAAAEGGAIGYGTGKALVNLKDAYYEEDEGVREVLLDRAKESAVETGKHAATSAGMMGAMALAPQAGGAAVAGVAGYQGTRAVLENTETGKAVDKAVQDKMTESVSIWDDLMRKLAGDKTVSEQEREAIAKRQDAWMKVLGSGKVELHEGATQEDLLVIIERMARDGKVATLDDLGDLKNVVKVAPQEQVARADCSKFEGTAPQWDEAGQTVRCNCASGKWSNAAKKCIDQKTEALAKADCSKYSNAEPYWDEAGQVSRCRCKENFVWNKHKTGCELDKDLQVAKASCSHVGPNAEPFWSYEHNDVRCHCRTGYEFNPDKTFCIARAELPHDDYGGYDSGYDDYSPEYNTGYDSGYNSGYDDYQQEDSGVTDFVSDFVQGMQQIQAAQQQNSGGGMNPNDIYKNYQGSQYQAPKGYYENTTYRKSNTGGQAAGFSTQGATPERRSGSYSGGGAGQGEFSVKKTGKCIYAGSFSGCLYSDGLWRSRGSGRGYSSFDALEKAER